MCNVSVMCCVKLKPNLLKSSSSVSLFNPEPFFQLSFILITVCVTCVEQ